MAIIQLGSLVSSIRGTIGGVTFSNSNAGIIAKSKCIGRKSTTTKGLTARKNLNNFVKGWQALSLVNQSLWDDYAALYTKDNIFGETRTLSGFNWYCSINWFRSLGGNSSVSTPPAHTLPQAVPSWSVSIVTNRLVVSTGTVSVGESEKLLFYLGSPYNLSANAFTSQLRYSHIDDLLSRYDYDISSEFENEFIYSFSSIISGGSFNLCVGLRVVNVVSGLVTSLDRKILEVS